jgi:hypothetical protein
MDTARAGRQLCLPAPGRPHRFWAADTPLLIAAPGGIEDCLHQINATATDDDRIRIGERYRIHVVPESAAEPAGTRLALSAQNYPIGAVADFADLGCAGGHNGGSGARTAGPSVTNRYVCQVRIRHWVSPLMAASSVDSDAHGRLT